MKVNSYAGCILTPMKKPVSGRPNRFSPTEEQKQILSNMEKVHKFLHHGGLFSSLNGIGLTCHSIADIEIFFKKFPDIPDALLKNEETAIAQKDFTEKIKQYIIEEFEIPGDYAFSAICILNFSFLEKLTVSEAGEHLFGLVDNDFVCHDCNTDYCEFTESEIQVKNLEVLKKLLNQTLLDDQLDDSDDDKEFELNETQQTVDSSSDESVEDVYKFNDDDENFTIVNPFAESSEARSDVKIVNSTFRSSSKMLKETFQCGKISPINKKQLSFTCKMCGKEFNKMYNLKLHRVSVHKDFPKGMTIFQCSVEGCRFSSGSEILFKRHSHKSALKADHERIICITCQETFAGKSSLVRHMKRKH